MTLMIWLRFNTIKIVAMRFAKNLVRIVSESRPECYEVD